MNDHFFRISSRLTALINGKLPLPHEPIASSSFKSNIIAPEKLNNKFLFKIITSKISIFNKIHLCTNTSFIFTRASWRAACAHGLKPAR